MIFLGIIVIAFYIFYLYNKINLNFINDQISKNILFLGIFLLLVGIILKFIKIDVIVIFMICIIITIFIIKILYIIYNINNI